MGFAATADDGVFNQDVQQPNADLLHLVILSGEKTLTDEFVHISLFANCHELRSTERPKADQSSPEFFTAAFPAFLLFSTHDLETVVQKLLPF